MSKTKRHPLWKSKKSSASWPFSSPWQPSRLSVAARLLFPEVSHLSDTPLLILLILSVCAIWRDALRSKKQNENSNE
ncbi:MAG: hypothetical protein ACLRM8_08095 [Alistipes sp.]